MTVKYVVTFEFDEGPQRVHRGIATGSTAPGVARRALKDAIKAHPKTVWSSLCLVFLERLPDTTAIPDAATHTGVELEAEASEG